MLIIKQNNYLFAGALVGWLIRNSREKYGEMNGTNTEYVSIGASLLNLIQGRHAIFSVGETRGVAEIICP